MTWMLAPVAGVALLFYLVLPGVGAFLARARWRTFREALRAVSRWPPADARHELPTAGAGEPDGFVGFRRLFGSLEALQGDDRIWLASPAGSVAVDLRGVSVYLLPAAAGSEGAREDEELSSVPGNRIFALSEGTTLLVGGALYREEGRAIFKARHGVPPLALIYDCPRSAIMRRAIRGGRHVNEYWNAFTLPSLVTGSFILAVLAWISIGQPDSGLAAPVALAAAAGPLLPFLPPAFPLYFLYRWCWRRGRRLRAERDLANLPLRWFPAAPGGGERFITRLPDAEPYAMLRGTLRDGRTLDVGGLLVGLPEGSIPAGEGGGRRSDIRVHADHAAIPGEGRRSDIRVGADRAAIPGEVWAFGAWHEQDGRVFLAEPDDPLAELTVVAGDPRVTAARCSSLARRYLAASAVLIGLAVAINLLLALFLAARIVG